VNKRNLALVLVVVGVIIYFYPQFQQFASDSSQLTGALFAVGGVILWYLPSKTPTKKKK
jgi:drug/metabolite transporter (DMT)-like permease